MTKFQKKGTSHLLPNIIEDATAEAPGFIAGELAAEQGDLINVNGENHLYGATNHGNEEPSEANTESHVIDADTKNVLPRAQLYTVISSIFTASYLSALDMTVVSTLLTVIASDLDAIENISWIATSYLLSNAAFQPLYGKLSDIFGRRAILLTCCTFFTVGCAICVTNSLKWLIIGRFVTGCGGSGLTSVGTMTMSDLIPLRERGLYQGLANVFFGLGAASGGLIGGVVADAFGWKYVFILQVPLGIAVGIAIYAYLVLPADSVGSGIDSQHLMQKVKRVDFLGSSALVSSLMCFMAVASLGGTKIAFSSLLFLFLSSAGFALLMLFVYIELYVTKEPILPLRLFCQRSILASSLTNWFYTMGTFCLIFFIPIFYMSVLHLSPTENGERTIPNFLGTSFGSVGAGLYMKKTGRYYKLLVVVGVIGTLGSLRVLYLTNHTSTLSQYLANLPVAYAYSNVLTVTLLSLIAAVPPEYQASVTSIQYTFRSTGSTLGVSIGSAIFQNFLKSTLITSINKVIKDPLEASKIIAKALKSAEYINEAPYHVREAIVSSYEIGCKGAFAYSFAMLVLGLASSLFIREHVLHTSIQRK